MVKFTIPFLLVSVLTSTCANTLDINWCGDQLPPQTQLETHILPFTLKPFNLKCKSPKLNTTLHPGLIESHTINGTENKKYNVKGILKLTGHLRLSRTQFLHTSQYCVSKLWEGAEPGTAEYCDQEAECGQNGLECIPLCCPPDLLFTVMYGKSKVECKSINSTHYAAEGYEKQLKALEKPGTKAVSYYRGKANDCDRERSYTTSRYHRGHWDPSASPTSKKDYFKRTENGDYLLCNDALDAWMPMKVVCLNIDSTLEGRPSEVGIPETVIMECQQKMSEEQKAASWFTYYYACMMTIGILFQLFVFVIYAMVWRQLGFGSRIIMGYSSSLFLLYLIFGIRYFYISVNGDKAYGTPGCELIGILGHYAWMSTFAWLLLINLNLFFIIWRPKAMNPGIRAPSDKWRIARYILFGWGLPGIYVIICAIIDKNHDRIEHKCTTPAPLYNHKGCFVHNSHAGIFMYYPSAVVLTINLILFIACLAKLYSPQQAKTLKNSSNRPQLFGIYARMFLVAGVYWILELIVWILIESGNRHATRDLILHTIKFILTFISFIIFVTGSNITKPLMNNYRGVRVSARWASRQLSQVTFFSRSSFSKDNTEVTTTHNPPHNTNGE